MNARNIGRAIAGAVVGVISIILVLPAVAVLAPLWIVDLLAKGFRRILEPRSVPWEDLVEFAPEVGWKPKAGVAANALDFNHDAYYVTTDGAGWRGRRTIDESDVIVFGDSYAFGCGVDDDAFFADLPTDVAIKAIGSPAYSMVHSLLWMERMAHQLSDKLVVWFVYPGNDLADNTDPAFLDYRAPFVRPVNGTDDWEIVTDHVSAERWTIDSREGEMQSYVKICSPTLQSERAFAACDFLLRRAEAVCRDASAELVVMSIPDLSLVARLALDRALEKSGNGAAFDPTLPDRRLEDTCRELGVRFIALRDHLTPPDYLERDFHWSARGNATIAEVIRRLYQEVS